MPFQDNSQANLARLGEEHDEFVASIVKEFEKSERVLSPWKNKLVKYYELYNLVQRDTNYAGLAKVFVPEILRAVETVVSKLYSLIFSSPDFMKYVGREESDEGSAIAMTQTVRYQMEENRFKPGVADSLRQMAVAGFTVRKILWDYQEVGRTRFGKNDKGERTRTADVQTVKDTWTFEPVDLLSFHISDPTTPYNDIQKATWIGEQYKVAPEYLKEKVRRGWYTDAMKDKLSGGKKEADSDASKLKQKRAQTAGYTIENDGPGHEVLERWGLVKAKRVYSPEELAAMTPPMDPEDMVEGVVVIVDRKAVYKLDANPFWHNQKPYVSCPFIAKENEFAGMGVSQVAEKLQEELNDTRNQTMDNKTLILMTMWLKSRASGIKNQDLRIRPMGVIATSDMTGLVALRPPVLTGVGVNIEGVVKDDLRQSVMASSNLQGQAQAGVDTATESSFINKESMSRLVMTAEMYGELVLKPTFIFAEYLNYQFFDHTKVIKIAGPVGVKFRKVSPKDLDGYKDVEILISTDSMENPAIKKQQAMAFFALLQNMLPEQIAFHWKMLDRMYKMQFNGRSLSEVYDAPVGKAEMYTPEEELEIALAEQPILAVPGQPHEEHIQFLMGEYESMKYALSPMQLSILQKLILSHQQLLQAELQQMEAQFMMGQMAQEKNGPNNAQMKNQSPSTLSNKPGDTPGSDGRKGA